MKDLNTYAKRPRGGWYATLPGNKRWTVVVTETPRHMRTSSFFRWDASKYYLGKLTAAGSGATRAEAIANLRPVN